jgi:hypothetical protein
MDEGSTLSSPSDGISLNISCGDSWGLPRAMRSPRTEHASSVCPCSTGFPHILAMVLVPLSPSDQILPHRSD